MTKPTLYYLHYYIVISLLTQWCNLCLDNWFYLFMNRIVPWIDLKYVLFFVSHNCTYLDMFISLTSGSGMSGTPSPGSATPAPGRRTPSLGRTRRGNCHGGTRSVGVSGGEKWEAGVTDCRYCGKLGRQALLASAPRGSRFLGKYFNWKLIHFIS